MASQRYAGGYPSGATPVRRFPPPLGSGVKRLAVLGRGGECYYFSNYTLQLTENLGTSPVLLGRLFFVKQGIYESSKFVLPVWDSF
jgi:hypothetical protein